MKPMRMAVALIVTGLAVVCGLAQVKGLKPDVIPEVPPLDLPVVDPKAVPENATFFMVTYMAEDNGGFGVPWPWNPLADLEVPVYWLQGSHYLVDDRVVGSVNQAMAAMYLLDRAAQGLPLDDPAEALRSSGPPPPTITTNDLWLELLDDEFTNGIALLKLHNTLDSAYAGYQLMIRTNDFSVPEVWMPGEIVQGATGTNVTDFSPVPIEANHQMYFRAHFADAVITVSASQPVAYEPNASFPDPAWQH